MRDFSRRTEKIAICRVEWEISRSVAENVKNLDLSRRIGNFAVSYMPRNPFVPAVYPGANLKGVGVHEQSFRLLTTNFVAEALKRNYK